MEPKPENPPVVEAPKLPMIPVAQSNLNPYVRITERDVMLSEAPSKDWLEEWLKKSGKKDPLPNTQRALGRLVKTTILAGQPICDSDLYEPAKLPQMADDLPAGYRAVNVRVDDAIASNGAILPGSFVDVQLTFESDHPKSMARRP